MKIAAIIGRVLMGLMFLFASIAYFLKLFPEPPMEGAMKVFNDGMNASVYLMPTVKAFELLCGLAFVTGFFVPLATVVIFPIIVNIVGVTAMMAPSGLPLSLGLLLINLFLAFYYRDRYAAMVKAK